MKQVSKSNMFNRTEQVSDSWTRLINESAVLEYSRMCAHIFGVCCRAANVQHLPTQLAESQAGLGDYVIQCFSYSQRNVLVGSRSHTLYDRCRSDTGICYKDRWPARSFVHLQIKVSLKSKTKTCIVPPWPLLTTRSLVLFKPYYPAPIFFTGKHVPPLFTWELESCCNSF